MASETEVTVAVSRYLVAMGFEIVSIALPGAGSGVVFHSEDEDYPSIVPDIIARLPDHEFIVIESKPKYDNNDIFKLKSLICGAYDKSIKTLLEVDKGRIRIAIAYPFSSSVVLKTSEADVDVIFTVDESQMVSVSKDESKIFLDRSL